MRSFFLEKWFKDIPISKKLYFTIGIMAFLILIELFTLGFAINTLSSIRALVGGEGLWSKSQKDALSSLRTYAYSHDEKDYRAFHEFLKVPIGDGKARKALEKPQPDYAMARQGFLEGRIHPDDIDGMIKLLIRFNNISYLKKTVGAWKKAETTMVKLIPASEQLHNEIVSGKITEAGTKNILNYIDSVNRDLTPLEDNFSYYLGEGSRWFEQMVLRILIGLALTVEVTGILIAVSVSRGIQKGLNAIIDGAEKVSKEVFNSRVRVYSKDEIGVLAVAFNQMTDRLEKTIFELKQAELKTNKQKDRAEESEKVKQLFITNMSHEIRTPMNAIVGFGQLLRESKMSKEQDEYIMAIVKSGEFLQHLLNNVLDLSKIQAGKVALEINPIDIESIMHTAISMSGSDAYKKSLFISYRVDERIPKLVYGDETRLTQILLNLIGNAIKYTFIGSVFTEVSFINETEETVWVEFSIQDTGIGIPLEKQDKIFESFEQLGQSKIYGSIGLGLSIAKELVNLQGGEIFIRSSSAKGSDFTFTLPFYKQEVKSNTPDVITDDIKNELVINRKLQARILVADDNQLNQLLMTRILQNRGFYVDVADSGRIVLEKLKAHKYDVILMDLDMPELNGYETTMAIRNWDNAKSIIPIIAVTAHATKEEREKCFKHGMNEFISKPFDITDLHKKILLFLD